MLLRGKSFCKARQEIEKALFEKIIPFWSLRSIDKKYGGYLLNFDENGEPYEETEKYLVTQARMLWGFSHLSKWKQGEEKEILFQYAQQGLQFLLEHFWDSKYGGFYWKVNRQGVPVDKAKLTYGETFAIYALSEYYLCFGDKTALEYAERTFDLLQIYAADTLNGGYYENIEENWERSNGGVYAGDRKSLDIHMHLMEALTTLYQASGKEIHRRKLIESIKLIMRHMVDQAAGYGYNQFDVSFCQLPAINIYRTWNAEREANEEISTPEDTTSYGHNVELSWLLDHAFEVLKQDFPEYQPVLRKLLDHSLQYGYDFEYGGVYRDGIADKEVLVKDKEWWQNFESLVGYLNGYVKYQDENYAAAFQKTWDFVRDHFMNMEVGESRQLLDRQGKSLVGNMGNAWKGIYHTGRALSECLERLIMLNAREEEADD
ncbi:N-acylglucosamine 2-epimerase (GlcNAc 2-epimerase) [uncultured Ruminococcus sp.]|uniref:AGE family epimerase/isomerase n=1 Tax=Massiliimalia timonensis TaxID=1987501 RepID=A0A8J6TP06_9FIRM|nr:AGE family epimerase/isomerase [Massiliimalia timonensis]MBC8609639.1 AGE family epimerase/isomerase [Massiliimalia timonensis]SCH33385.1 N-acylglucosamine 2-epimerase (GlcNAc 2-epimerase) [uncultured Ruminococcus sp.]SCH36265.1 N-acylglucosamine 2-epimerase (GlcNAc 2-epimerase) [uncultured Clostridium sp.]